MKQPLGQSRGSWRAARPELGIAAVALAACAAAAYAVASSTATVVVVVVFAVIAFGVVSRLLPAVSGPAAPEISNARRLSTSRTFTYWRLQSQLKDGIASRSAYETTLGPHMEHLLAARLSERHGVSLYGRPDLARDILCANAKDLDLWSWVDPSRPAAVRVDAPGIPAKTLARLVQRIEQL